MIKDAVESIVKQADSAEYELIIVDGYPENDDELMFFVNDFFKKSSHTVCILQKFSKYGNERKLKQMFRIDERKMGSPVAL